MTNDEQPQILLFAFATQWIYKAHKSRYYCSEFRRSIETSEVMSAASQNEVKSKSSLVKDSDEYITTEEVTHGACVSRLARSRHTVSGRHRRLACSEADQIVDRLTYYELCLVSIYHNRDMKTPGTGEQ